MPLDAWNRRDRDARASRGRARSWPWLAAGLFLLCTNAVQAADGLFVNEAGQVNDVKGLISAGGSVGYVIIGLSVAMLALIIEHLLSIRRGALIPMKLAEEAHQLVAAQQYQQAAALCQQRPSFLGFVVASGLNEAPLGYAAVEKAMEDAAAEQAARLFRKIEYLSVIGVIAPMLGLLGTVWGMILAFGQFAHQANPSPSELAPAISLALVTTLQGLVVAIPALGAFSMFRNRIDEFIAEASLTAERVLAPLKMHLAEQRRTARADSSRRPARTPIPPVAMERESRP